MDRPSNVIDRDGTAATSEARADTSPFASGVRLLVGPAGAETADHGEGEHDSSSWLASPFSEGMLDANQSEAEAAFTTLAAELEDEEFEEAVQALVDEAAGRHLMSGAVWSTEATTHLATDEVETWMAGIAAEADGLLEHLEVHFGARTPESLVEGEIDAVLAEALADRGGSTLDGEDFIGKLARKARSLVKGVATVYGRGLAIAGRHLLGPLFGILRKVVPHLLRRVLSVALNKIPPHLQKDAAALAGKLGVALPAAAATAAPVVPAGPVAPDASPAEPASPAAAGAALAELFDAQLAQAAIADNQAALDHLGAEAESAAEDEGDPAVAHLDAGRAVLASQLADAAPGSVLTAELEQFIPVVMAALPLVRTGIRLLGRDKVVGLVAKPLAELIKGHIGPEATRALSRAIADKGLGLLRLEAEGDEELGAEALVSTLEDTLRAVGQLPPESQAEPLRLQAELQEAFAGAAARHLPAEMLRADLDAHEVDGESAVWVLMPRGPSRRYRYRKCSRTFPTRISRHVARAIVVSDGGTLEQRLLDEGATGWPAEAEVHLYEALPGTHLGHLAAAEGDSLGALDTSEFEELTPDTASLLLSRPGLGRRAAAGGAGRRYYRVAVPRRGGPRRKRFRRMVVRLGLTGPRPLLRVHLRLSEREAHRVGERLAGNAHVRVVAAFRSLILDLAQRSLPDRVVRQARRTPGAVLSMEQARLLAGVIGERMVAAVAAQLRAMAPTLAAATRDPASGVTLTFEFGFADRAALTAGRTDAPTVTVRPGRLRD